MVRSIRYIILLLFVSFISNTQEPLEISQDSRWSIGMNFGGSLYRYDPNSRQYSNPKTVERSSPVVSLLGLFDDDNTYGIQVGYVIHPRISIVSGIEYLRLDFNRTSVCSSCDGYNKLGTQQVIEIPSMLNFYAFKRHVRPFGSIGFTTNFEFTDKELYRYDFLLPNRIRFSGMIGLGIELEIVNKIIPRAEYRYINGLTDFCKDCDLYERRRSFVFGVRVKLDSK